MHVSSWGQVQVQVSGAGGRWSGLVGGVSGPRCGLLEDSLLSGDATWASSVCAAISGLGAGMWYRAVRCCGC